MLIENWNQIAPGQTIYCPIGDPTSHGATVDSIVSAYTIVSLKPLRVIPSRDIIRQQETRAFRPDEVSQNWFTNKYTAAQNPIHACIQWHLSEIEKLKLISEEINEASSLQNTKTD